MLDRNLSFVLRHGELVQEASTTYKYVGGSPITINSSGRVSGNIDAYGFNGVAWNSYENDKALGGLCTIIIPPAIITIKPEEDGTTPWKKGITYAVGNLLRPTTTTGTPAYAVWTNEAFPNDVANAQYTFSAKIIAIEGTGSSPTSMTLLVAPAYAVGS